MFIPLALDLFFKDVIVKRRFCHWLKFNRFSVSQATCNQGFVGSEVSGQGSV
jgi:hypothetical protein